MKCVWAQSFFSGSSSCRRNQTRKYWPSIGPVWPNGSMIAPLLFGPAVCRSMRLGLEASFCAFPCWNSSFRITRVRASNWGPRKLWISNLRLSIPGPGQRLCHSCEPHPIPAFPPSLPILPVVSRITRQTLSRGGDHQGGGAPQLNDRAAHLDSRRCCRH